MSAREFLEKANHYQIKPEELFQYFATNIKYLTVMYQRSSTDKKPLLARSNRPGSKYVIAFTDQEATEIVKVHQPEYLEMVDEPAIAFLLKAYRSNAEGLMFNPGLSSRFFVVRHQLLEWIRFYSMQIFSEQADVWVIRVQSSIVKGVYQTGFSTVAIYTAEQEAKKYAGKLGGVATRQSWSSIFDYLERIGSRTLFVNYGLPEAFLLNPAEVRGIYDIQFTNSNSTLPTEAETAITQESIYHESATQEEEANGDWETVFSEEEPLTVGKDIEYTGRYTNTQLSNDRQPTIPNRSDEKVLIDQIQNETITIEKVDPNESLSMEKTSSSLDNSWTDEEDSFEEVPKPNLLFQSENNEQENGHPEIESVLKPEAKQELEPELTIDSTHEEPEPRISSTSVPDDIDHGLQLLEKATNDGQGMANGWEVCRSLADLRRIWVIVDMEGKMVILASQDESQVADFFTSEQYAKSLIVEAHLRNPNLPAMVPRLISTKKLFKALAPTGCIIWINRGSAIAWTSIMGDTLPYVLQLMAQKE